MQAPPAGPPGRSHSTENRCRPSCPSARPHGIVVGSGNPTTASAVADHPGVPSYLSSKANRPPVPPKRWAARSAAYAPRRTTARPHANRCSGRRSNARFQQSPHACSRRHLQSRRPSRRHRTVITQQHPLATTAHRHTRRVLSGPQEPAPSTGRRRIHMRPGMAPTARVQPVRRRPRPALSMPDSMAPVPGQRRAHRRADLDLAPALRPALHQLPSPALRRRHPTAPGQQRHTTTRHRDTTQPSLPLGHRETLHDATPNCSEIARTVPHG